MMKAITLKGFGYLIDDVPEEIMSAIQNDLEYVKQQDNEMISGLTRPGAV